MSLFRSRLEMPGDLGSTWVSVPAVRKSVQWDESCLSLSVSVCSPNELKPKVPYSTDEVQSSRNSETC